jgi:hypothetical protein
MEPLGREVDRLADREDGAPEVGRAAEPSRRRIADADGHHGNPGAERELAEARPRREEPPRVAAAPPLGEECQPPVIRSWREDDGLVTWGAEASRTPPPPDV